MIRSVTFEKTTYADLPNKFEAGTPHIAGAIGLGAAVDYIAGVGFEGITAHESDLLEYGTAALREALRATSRCVLRTSRTRRYMSGPNYNRRLAERNLG